METEIKKVLKKYNNTYQEIYCFTVRKYDGHYVIVDEFEEFYYESHDFDNLFEELTTDLKKLFKNDSLYLE